MDVKSRKAEQSEATRAALLKVARKLFTERGYADTATEEVVRRARVTRGALYHHFKDKEDLFNAVLDEEERRLTGKIAEAALHGGDAWNQMIAGCQAFLDACLEPSVQRIVLIDAPAVLGWARWRKMDDQYALGMTRASIENAIAAGFIDPQPVDALAHIWLGAMNEAAMVIATAGDKDAARKEVGAAVNALLKGFRSTGKRRR